MSGPRVQSFPPNRVCAECATVLSIYNETEFCSLHGRPRKWLVNRVEMKPEIVGTLIPLGWSG
jgi:hypothetical protein